MTSDFRAVVENRAVKSLYNSKNTNTKTVCRRNDNNLSLSQDNIDGILNEKSWFYGYLMGSNFG